MKEMGVIIGSVFISVIIVGAGVYIGLPLLYPSLKDENENEYVTQEDFNYLTENNGILIQSKFQQFTTACYINSSQVTPIPIPATTMDFTIQNNSKITVLFAVPTVVSVSSTFQGYTAYTIVLGIDGIGNTTAMVRNFDHNSDITNVRQYCDHLYIYYETEALPAGTYHIQTFYYSEVDVGTLNTFVLSSTAQPEKYPRSLLAHELKTE